MPSASRWIKCIGCDGEVGVPDGFLEQTATCPKCGALVAIEDSGLRIVQWRPSRTAEPEITPSVVAPARRPSDWRGVAGWITFGIGIAGFMASYRLEPKPGGETSGAVVAALLNPFFFIGVPLGIYWLKVSGVLAALVRIGIGNEDNSPSEPRLRLQPAQYSPDRTVKTNTSVHERSIAPEFPSPAPIANAPKDPPLGPTVDSPEAFKEFLQEQHGPKPLKPKPDYLIGIVLTLFAVGIVAMALFGWR